jgi:hypothetical protein
VPVIASHTTLASLSNVILCSTVSLISCSPSPLLPLCHRQCLSYVSVLLKLYAYSCPSTFSYYSIASPLLSYLPSLYLRTATVTTTLISLVNPLTCVYSPAIPYPLTLCTFRPQQPRQSKSKRTPT